MDDYYTREWYEQERRAARGEGKAVFPVGNGVETMNLEPAQHQLPVLVGEWFVYPNGEELPF